MVRRPLSFLLLPAALLMACGSSASQSAADTSQIDPGPAEVSVDVAPADSPPSDSSDVTRDVADDTAADTAADTTPSEDVEPDIPEPAPASVRFVVLGDTGEGNEDQVLVANAIKAKCDLEGCDFALLAGDNIYNSGVDSVTDPQWQDKFEVPYQDLDFPFYAVLGNHDNGGLEVPGLDGIPGLDELGEGSGGQFWKGDIQIEYTAHSDKWTMPARYYDWTAGPAHFFALDTNDMMWSQATELYPEVATRYQQQLDDMGQRINESTAVWKIVFGHHPYISNGAHGNAGNYEGDPLKIAADLLKNIPLVGDLLGDVTAVSLGVGVKDGVEAIVCNKVDFYMSGHDHNRQWLVPTDSCPGVQFIVSGAGAKVKDFAGSLNATVWQEDATEGFVWIRIEGNTLHAEFIDKYGTVNFVRDMVK